MTQFHKIGGECIRTQAQDNTNERKALIITLKKAYAIARKLPELKAMGASESLLDLIDNIKGVKKYE